jgi:hypothetical protein
MNNIFYDRIMQLIAMTYGMTKETVWNIYNDVKSIDKTIETIQNIKNPFEQLKNQ